MEVLHSALDIKFVQNEREATFPILCCIKVEAPCFFLWWVQRGNEACIRCRFLRDMRCSSDEDAYSQWRRMRSFWLCPYLISFLHGAVVSLSSCSAPVVHGWLGVHWPCSSEKEENLAEYLKLFLYLCAGWL